MQRFDLVIIGGGAAGITAAISAKRSGASVLLCERTARLGRKILASGNGRCNLLNDKLDESYYNPAAQSLVKSVFSRFGKTEMLNFFQDLGLATYAENGRIFPLTNQSASVLKVLEMELKRLLVPVELNFEAVDISGEKNGFLVKAKSGKNIKCAKLVIACGGKTYPALGADGSSYRLAGRFGHQIIEAVPSAVPIVVKDRLCHILQGQRIFAAAKSIIDDNVTSHASGEILFTKYGLSGSAVLDVSREISIAINRNRKKDAAVSIDLIPFMDREKLKSELTRRRKKNLGAENLLLGILPNKFGLAFKDLFNGHDTGVIAQTLKDKRFKVIATRGWNEAEFTSGGIAAGEVKEGHLESKFQPGLYFAGEILDVDGKRGGYNLAWAWASGFVSALRG